MTDAPVSDDSASQTPPPPPSEEPAPDVAAEQAKEQKEFYVGQWAGHDNFGCPYCPFLTLDGSLEVMWHINEMHKDKAIGVNEEV